MIYLMLLNIALFGETTEMAKGMKIGIINQNNNKINFWYFNGSLVINFRINKP